MMVRHLYCSSRLLACSFLSFLIATPLANAENPTVTVPSGTPLPVQAQQHYPMKAGTKIEARLLYPIYSKDHIVIPTGTLLRGSVIQLDPDKHRRIRSRFDGDFTPFHIPVVRFDQLLLPDGSVEGISSTTADNGAPILRLASPGANAKKGSLVSREIAQAKQEAKSRIAMLTAPGKGDRMLQFVYHQLPYHPERIEKGTAWTVELTQPLDLKPEAFPSAAKPAEQSSANQSDPQSKIKSSSAPAINQASQAEASDKKQWLLDAYLKQTLSSATAKPGQEIRAVVAQPVFNADRTVAVPQGAMLIGTVTEAKSAKSLGRKGKLRFAFRQIKLPEGNSQHVEGVLAAAASSTTANLQMNSEGEVQPKTQDRIIMPLALSLLASRALDRDGSQAANGTVASNGFGIIGRVLGIAAGSRNLAAGIGFYGAALSVYDRWLTHGRDVVFAKDTRVEILTTPVKSSVLSPK